MSDIIQLLPDHVANQIAAGEVVQRPSSVVKELIENAIDANADTITLLIKDAGKKLIQVIDNGKGMSSTDARLCFERHATSKIRNAKDLFNLHTKGFRGEALASIAAVAHVELKTRLADEELGTCIKNEGNTIVSQEVVQTAQGTSISVKNLFFNIPARRNFLKSESIETRHIIDEFLRVALAHPQISFALHHNNKDIYDLRAGTLRQRIVSVFGNKMEERLVPINETTDILNITGYVAKPEFAKKKRGEQFFFVNDRFIKSPYLHHAVVNAFEGLIDSSQHPSYFLYLNVPANTIDINIHPTKTEIKFDNEKALYAMLRATIKHSLGQYNVAPVLDFTRDASLDTPYEYKDKTPITPKITVDPNFNPFKTEDSPKSYPSSSNKTFTSKIKDVGNWESLYTDLDIKPMSEPKQSQLFESEQEIETGKTFQIQKKYILSTIKSGIVLIHQSLAHQRILYDDFLNKMTNKQGSSQQLLFPISINFQQEDIELIQTIKSDLEHSGFVFNDFSSETIVIGGIPTLIKESEITQILEQLLEDLRMEVPDTNFNYVDLMAKSFAKSVSIKTGKNLSPKEQETLVNNLFSCPNPTTAPNGKTIFKTLNLNDIDSIFNS